MHEPRGKLSMALYYATSPRGGTHVEGTVLDNEPACPELGVNMESEPRSWKNKPAIAVAWQHARSFANCLVLCELCSVSARGEEDPCLFFGLGDILSTVLGQQVTPDDLERAIDELWQIGGYLTYGPSPYRLRQLGLDGIL